MFNKLLPYILVAVLAAFAFMGLQLYSATTNNALLASQVNTLQTEKETKQAEVNQLADAVDVAGRALSMLEQDRALVVNLHKEQMAGQQLIAEQLSANKAQVNQLRQSNDEYVKAWSATHMPGAAVRLYPYAEYTGNYPDGGAESASVSDTAGKFAGRLHTSNHF